jgi:hypothetical protein
MTILNKPKSKNQKYRLSDKRHSLERQISSSLFERKIIENTKLSTELGESNQEIYDVFNPNYLREILYQGRNRPKMIINSYMPYK